RVKGEVKLFFVPFRWTFASFWAFSCPCPLGSRLCCVCMCLGMPLAVQPILSTYSFAMKLFRSPIVLGGSVLTFLSLLAAAPLQASVYLVLTTADSGPGSLRQA